MKWPKCYRIRLVLIGFVAALVISGTSTKADFTFGEPTIVEAPINEDYRMRFVGCITADNLQLYLDQHVGAWNSPTRWDIMVSTRATTTEPWPMPVSVGAAVNNGTFNYNAAISNDGLKLYFESDRPGGHGGQDIWVTTRLHKGEEWQEPVNLGPPFNTSSHDGCVWISSNGLEFYFSTNRAGGSDIWVSKRQTQDDDWGTPENLGPLVNTSEDELYHCLSPDDLILFFCRGDWGKSDMWMSRRRSVAEPWQAPVKLDQPLNSSTADMNPRVSPDGRILYFTSHRHGVYKLESKGWHVWQATIDPIVDFTGARSADIGPMPWGDGIVDLKDFSMLGQYWGHADVEDLSVLAEDWLKAGKELLLIAHWKLDEADGFIAHDSAGDNDDFVIAEDPLWRPDDGKIGGALQLDGIDDYVSTQFVLNPAQSPFSLFMWVKGGLPGQFFLSQKNGTDWLYTLPPMGWLMTSLGQAAPLMAQVVITDGLWHRIGFTWDGTNRILYVDDVEAAKDTDTGMESADAGLYFGAGNTREPETFFSGLIDDIRIYNCAIVP